MTTSNTWTVFLLDSTDDDFYEEFSGTREECTDFMLSLNDKLRETAYATDCDDNYFSVL